MKRFLLLFSIAALFFFAACSNIADGAAAPQASNTGTEQQKKKLMKATGSTSCLKKAPPRHQKTKMPEAKRQKILRRRSRMPALLLLKSLKAKCRRQKRTQTNLKNFLTTHTASLRRASRCRRFLTRTKTGRATLSCAGPPFPQILSHGGRKDTWQTERR